MTFATNLIDTLLSLATQQVQTLQALKDSLQVETAAPAAPTLKVYEVVDAYGTNNLEKGARVVVKQTRTEDGQLEMEAFDWLDTDGSTEDSTGRRLGWYRATRFTEVGAAPTLAKQATTYPKDLVVVDAGNKRLISNGQTVVALTERTEDGELEYRIANVYGKELGWYRATRFKDA